MVDSLEHYEFVHVELGFAPGPEEVPVGFEVLAVGELLPALASKETRRDDIVDFLLSFDNPIKLSVLALFLSAVFELTLDVRVEYFHSFDESL